MPRDEDRRPGGQEWRWVARGFLGVVVLGAAAALAIWLWVRPLREGFAQAALLWLGCLLIAVSAIVAVGPGRRHHREHPHHRRAWLAVGGLLGASVVMAGIGLLATREDRRPALRELVEAATQGQPVSLVGESTWAYQPRFLGGLGENDWSVCRTYRVDGATVEEVRSHVAAELSARGLAADEASAAIADDSWRYYEVTPVGAELIVCAREVDPDAR